MVLRAVARKNIHMKFNKKHRGGSMYSCLNRELMPSIPVHASVPENGKLEK